VQVNDSTQEPTTNRSIFYGMVGLVSGSCNFAATNHEQVATLMVESSRIAAAPLQISLSTLTMQALACLVCPFKLPLPV